jgi:tetratricopeptide (TPR) repeat protein
MSQTAAACIAEGERYLMGGAIRKASHSFRNAARTAADAATRSEALRRQADTHRRCGEWVEALALAAEAQLIALEADLAGHASAAANIQGSVFLQTGEFDRAIEHFAEALRLRPSHAQSGLICMNVGTCYAIQQQFPDAALWYKRAQDAFAEANLVREQVLVMNNLGSVRQDQGDFSGAAETFLQATRLLQKEKNPDIELEAILLLNRAEALARQELDLEQASSLVIRALGHFSATGNRPHTVSSYRVLAMIAAKRGEQDTEYAMLQQGLHIARQLHAKPDVEYFEAQLLRFGASAAENFQTTGPR